MPVRIETVETRAQMREFVLFPEKLYSACEHWCPALEGDEYRTFDRKKNGAYEFCDSCCYLAYLDGDVVGRVAAIINRTANEKWGEKTVRFGWLDFIDDEEVLSALIGAVEAWGKERGCDSIKGPLGFTDMDKEGLLVDGYDRMCPFTCLYNYPYYDTLLAKIGFTKDADWTQTLVHVSEKMPDRLKLADAVAERYHLTMAKCRTTPEIARKYGLDMFHMYNESFAPLFQFTPLTDKQIHSYVKTYRSILDPDFVAVCLGPDGKPIGFGFCVPSLSKAVKKSRGRLFPFGFLRILHALRRNDTLEALMVGVLPEYQGKGAMLMIMKQIHENCLKRGIKRLLLNPELENNFKVQTLFNAYETEPYMRRRAYVKAIA